MTWDEVKAEVERALAEAGVDGQVQIDWVDFSGWTGRVHAHVHEETQGVAGPNPHKVKLLTVQDG